jgi:hypothetical protein
MMKEELSSAGLVEHEGLWRDPDDTIGAVVSPLGIFVGWIDVIWPSPSYSEPRLRDVVHVPPANIETDLRPVLARAEARFAGARRTCRYCGRHFAPGHMHSPDVCQGCAPGVDY